jgi:hypothetical protein
MSSGRLYLLISDPGDLELIRKSRIACRKVEICLILSIVPIVHYPDESSVGQNTFRWALNYGCLKTAISFNTS